MVKDEYDVLVVGGGPAGCAAAAVSARQGLEVLQVERNAEPQFKVGESLMPETYWAFEKMGVLPAMQASSFVEKHSVQFWNRKGRASAPFYFRTENDHESAQTWQVERVRFDRLLLENSAKQGVDCQQGCSVREVLCDGEAVVGAHLEWRNGLTRQVHCRVMIDATGQSSLLAKHFHLAKIDYGLRHASIFTHFEGARRDSGRDEGATLILQTCPAGDAWFWYIPLAQDRVSVGVVAKAEFLKRPGSAPHEVFFEEVSRCPEVQDRLKSAHQCRPVQVLRDFSYRFDAMAGQGWILVGDAFSFIDPVYSSGVFLALQSGVLAAESAAAALAEGELSGEVLGEFRGDLMEGVEAIRGLVEAFYNPRFSFGEFLRRFPEHRSGVTKILIGDVFGKDFSQLFGDMEATTASECP